MVKALVAGSLKDVEAAAREGRNSLLVVARSKGEIWSKNLKLKNVDMKFNKETGEVTLSFKLNDGDFLMIMDDPQKAEAHRG